MEGSFSHDNHRPQNTVPQRNQFAPNKRGSVDFRDPEQRRRYVNEQVAAHVPLEERLRTMREVDAFNEEREEEAVHAQEQLRYWQELLEEGERTESIYTDGYQREQEEEARRLHEEARRNGRIEAEVERQHGTPLRLRDAQDRRKLSKGEYRDQGESVSGTRGDVQGHVDRLRLGQYKTLERLDAELRELADRRAHLRKMVPPPDGSWSEREMRTYRDAYTELDRLQQSLDELRSSANASRDIHGDAIVDAALRTPNDSPRSHVAKPIKPRGDGRSIRMWDDV